MKLNLGSGNSGPATLDLVGGRAGWKSIDICEDFAADEHYDIGTGIREPDGSIEEVWMGDFFEHLLRSKGRLVLGEIHRVLRPKGLLRICVPDMAQVMPRWLAADGMSEDLNCLMWGQQGDSIGGANAYPDAHVQGFTEKSLAAALTSAGFIEAQRIVLHGPGCWYELSMSARRP